VDLNYIPNLVELPPPEIMDEIANLYFIHCHNQPYSVFHERSFKINLQAGLIDPVVQYTILGMALRFYATFNPSNLIDSVRTLTSRAAKGNYWNSISPQETKS
jgi:hypothetical protein